MQKVEDRDDGGNMTGEMVLMDFDSQPFEYARIVRHILRIIIIDKVKRRCLIWTATRDKTSKTTILVAVFEPADCSEWADIQVTARLSYRTNMGTFFKIELFLVPSVFFYRRNHISLLVPTV